MPFLFKNIGILKSFFSFGVPGVWTQGLTLLRFLSHFLSFEACTTPFALSLYFRWGLLLLCHQVLDHNPIIVSWVATTIGLCFYVWSMTINIWTTKLLKNMFVKVWMYYITEYLIICIILTTYSWWEPMWSQSTVVLKSLSPSLYTGNKTFP
jgi:hypothetical protein